MKKLMTVGRISKWKMMAIVKRLGRAEEGATMIEYALLAALISIVALIAITLVGTNVNLIFTAIAAALAPVI